LIPVYIATRIAGPEFIYPEIYVCAVALSVFFGHLYPVFLSFKSGGKGVAIAAGCFSVLSPITCMVCVAVFILVVFFSNRVSAGSLSAAVVLPIAAGAIMQSVIMTGLAAVIAAFICFRHKDNIKRLVSGTEPTLWRRGQ
jgi:glycerol-3-phosphate acyltransferase PlsY